MVDIGPFSESADGSMLLAAANGADGPSGCLVGFHTQCSIDPPRYLVCLSKANHTYDVARECEVISVNLLSHDQRALAVLFGSETEDEGVDKFSACRWATGPTGGIILDGVAAWMVGSVGSTVDLGDHVGFVLDPTSLEIGAERRPPLRYRDVRDIPPGHPG